MILCSTIVVTVAQADASLEVLSRHVAIAGPVAGFLVVLTFCAIGLWKWIGAPMSAERENHLAMVVEAAREMAKLGQALNTAASTLKELSDKQSSTINTNIKLGEILEDQIERNQKV